MATPKPVTFKLPKTLAACADLLYTTQQKRYALDKQSDAMKAEEAQLREHLINNLPKSDATGVAGSIARASISIKEVVQVKDWEGVYAHILKNAKKDPGVWSLLQKRVGDKAVKEVLESGKKIPGVELMDVKTVSLNKVG